MQATLSVAGKVVQQADAGQLPAEEETRQLIEAAMHSPSQPPTAAELASSTYSAGLPSQPVQPAATSTSQSSGTSADKKRRHEELTQSVARMVEETRNKGAR